MTWPVAPRLRPARTLLQGEAAGALGQLALDRAADEVGAVGLGAGGERRQPVGADAAVVVEHGEPAPVGGDPAGFGDERVAHGGEAALGDRAVVGGVAFRDGEGRGFAGVVGDDDRGAEPGAVRREARLRRASSWPGRWKVGMPITICAMSRPASRAGPGLGRQGYRG